MAPRPAQLGQQPSPNAGPPHYPSPTSAASRSSQVHHRSASIYSSSSTTKHSSSSSSLLSEEQLAKLPPIFREKSHQQCIEMDGNLFGAPVGDGGRDSFSIAFNDGIRLLPGLLTTFFVLMTSVLGAWAIIGLLIGSVIPFLGFVFGVPGYLVKRHYTLVSQRRSIHEVSSTNLVPGPSFLMFIMGSGGHTTEIISMIEHSIRPSPGTFRRYIVNEDDGMTKRRILDLEKRIGDRLLHLGEEPGLFDVLEVKRARKVHQSWMSTPYTAVMSIVSIAKILFQECPALMEKRRPDWRFPKVVVTNGPGTGFLVLAVIHFCKMVELIPTQYMHTVYVESFAKVQSLSLTGRLVHHSDVADLFLVQHASLAQRYGRVLASNFVVRPSEAVVPQDEE